MVGGNRTVIDDAVVRSRVEHEALDDGNGHGESASYTGITGPKGPTSDGYRTESDSVI